MGSELLNLFDYEARAQTIIPRDIWGFISGWAQDGLTSKRNREALQAIQLRPHFLRDVTRRDISTTILGNHISFPVMISPAGGQILVHPEGERATAQAAGEAGTIMVVPTSSGYSIEEVARVAKGPLWFQLYHCGEELTTMLVRRAENAGYAAIVLTVDTPLPSPKEIDVRNKFHRPEGGRLGNFDPELNKHYLPFDIDPRFSWERPPTIPLTFDKLGWLRSLTSLPLVVKGVRTAGDAQLCVAHGVDAILVSNHGGRQMDATLSSIETLPEVVQSVNGRAEVYMDSGVRRGSDVLKALALGARAVFIGRPIFWGLAVAGIEGTLQILKILHNELDLAMGYCGVTSVDQIDTKILEIPTNVSDRVPSYIVEIRELASLYDDGIITLTQFETKKRRLLGL